MAKKTKEQLAAEVPEGGRRLTKQTKVVALQTGYYDTIREQGDVFYVREGTIMEPDCWFEPVSDNTSTNEELDGIEDMSVPEIKVELAKKGVDFAGVTKKADLADLLIKARNAENGDDGDDLA